MKISILLAAGAALLVGTASAANIVINPGFETGDFTGWTANGWDVSAGTAGVSPNSGMYFATNGCEGSGCISSDTGGGAWFYQDLATTVGDSYTLTFFYAPGLSGDDDDDDGSGIELQVLWGATDIPLVASANGSCDTVNTNCIFDSTSTVSGTTYVQYTVTGLTASTTSTRLEFAAEQEPAYNGVDDIDVEDVGSTGTAPEPASMLFVGGGLALAALLKRRRLS